MTEWLTVLSLLSVGLVLLLIEFFLVPGVTVLGIMGLLAMFVGIGLSYTYFDTLTGHFVLAGSVLFSLFWFVQSFRVGFWDRFALKKQITAQVNEDESPITVGMIGKTLSALRPFGKVRFENGQIREVFSDTYLEPHTTIVVIQIDGKKIIVKQQ